LANEAAVGAKRPDDGREARGAVTFDAGVIGRAVADPTGVGDLTEERGSVDGTLRVPGPFNGVRGVGVLARLARVVDVDEREPAAAVDFEGDAGAFVGLGLGAARRDVVADEDDLLAGTGAAVEVGGAEMLWVGVTSDSAVGGFMLEAGVVSGVGTGCVSAP